MTCQEARNLIVETLTGTTPPDTRRAVEAHLADCAACRSEAAVLEQTAALLRSSPEPHLRDEHWAAFMAELETALESERRGLWNGVVHWMRNPRHAWNTAAATAALVVALGIALLVGPSTPPVTSDVPSELSGLVSEQVVQTMPAMSASLSVWKAALGAADVSYELTGGR